MSLHYVFLFSYDKHKYHYEMQLLTNFRNREKFRMSQQIYYRYRLHIRNANFSILHYIERFFQQYVIDVYVNCDFNRTTWFYKHQNEIRTNFYNEFTNNLQQNNVNVEIIKRRFIFSIFYKNDFRFIQKLFQNNMTIVDYYERSSMFIIMIVNSYWSEIQIELRKHFD